MKYLIVLILFLSTCLPVSGDVFDLSAYIPYIGDQGKQASCVAWSVATAKTIMDKSGWYSPAYIYNQRPLRYPCEEDDSVHFYQALQIVKDMGIAPMELFPYDENNQCSLPSQEVIAEAQQYRMGHRLLWRGVGNGSSPLTEYYLSMGIPVMILMRIYWDFNYVSCGRPVLGAPREGFADYPQGNHGVVIVGYDEHGFKFVNSYGPEWGCNGCGYMSEQFLEQQVWEAWILEELYEHRTYISLVTR